MLLSFDIFERNVDLINRINVFPVADKDTGNNLLSAITPLKNRDFTSIQSLSDLSIEDIIMYGRGCSGNIFSLFLTGLCQNCSDNLTDMFKLASEFVWSAMYNPVEGTILTAMKDVPEEYDSLSDFFYRYIQNTYSNLMSGPDILTVLKENNTLDSGTVGFLYILCDIYRCLTGQDISPDLSDLNAVYAVNSAVDNRYCVEISLFTENEELKHLLSKMGSELIYLHSGTKVKLHIHTDNYMSVMHLCQENGKIDTYKIEDMTDGNRLVTL